MSLLSITNLTFAWPGSYDNVFTDLNLQLDTGWKLGLTGRNGRGKTTLLRLLCGEEEYAGSIRLAEQPPRVPHPAPPPQVEKGGPLGLGGGPGNRKNRGRPAVMRPASCSAFWLSFSGWR